MPSPPSFVKIARKVAGTETRPLLSTLLMKVETNWSVLLGTLGPTD